MEYREIVAVTGLGGLYQLLTTKSDGAIVRNVAIQDQLLQGKKNCGA